MKRAINFLVIVSLLAIAASCSKSKQSESVAGANDSTESKEPGEPKQESTDVASSTAKGIVLKGIYVTSTQIPHSKFSYQNLFDGDISTSWSTMTGAGPDEGIMLYFDSPLSIDALEILQPNSGMISPIDGFVIYVNGQKLDYR